MTVFVDTSAFYAASVSNDIRHAEAARTWQRFVDERADLVTSNYVVVETCSLLQSRVGLDAVHSYIDVILPPVRVLWVDATTHVAGLKTLFRLSRRLVGLVDCVSFDLMKQSEIKDVFAFDPHFAEQGFKVMPTTGSGSGDLEGTK
jgi:predicted nucleic acid-binding protein